MDVTLEDARKRLEHLLDLAADGTEIAVVRDGKPRVLLVMDDVARPSDQLRGAALRKKIDDIVASVRPADIPLDQRTSNHDDMYDEFGLPK